MEECFSRFLNCTNGTKSHNASHMIRAEDVIEVVVEMLEMDLKMI